MGRAVLASGGIQMAPPDRQPDSACRFGGTGSGFWARLEYLLWPGWGQFPASLGVGQGWAWGVVKFGCLEGEH